MKTAPVFATASTVTCQAFAHSSNLTASKDLADITINIAQNNGNAPVFSQVSLRFIIYYILWYYTYRAKPRASSNIILEIGKGRGLDFCIKSVRKKGGGGGALAPMHY